MHFIIKDAWLAKSRAVHLSGTKLVLALLTLSLVLVLMAAGLYHWVLLKGARERWPVIGSVVRFVVQDEFEQRDRFMRENLDAMARKLGDARVDRDIARVGRAGTSADIAPVILFLCSDAARWINGANIAAVGGLEASINAEVLGF